MTAFTLDVAGAVVRPGDADYDTARTIFYGGFDARPAAIVRAAGADDVARVVRAAAEAGTELAVRSGGHSVAGHSSTEGGVLLDLRDLTRLDVDVQGRTAWAGTGLTAGAYTHALGRHGLATGFGDTGSVGIGGISLGGGVGFLARRLGLTIDSIVGAEVVTADGRVLQVDDDHEPDLFWAVRGGGGNVGVVTRLGFRLHEVDRVTGGMLVLPATAEVVEGVVAAAAAAPEELSTIVNVATAPPMPTLPPELHGELAVIVLAAYADADEAAGARALAPFRALGQPLVDTVGPLRYPELFPPDPPGFEDYHPTATGRNFFLDEFGADAAATVVDTLAASDAGMRAAQLRVLGGAVSRVPADATAYAHRDRDRAIMVNLGVFCTDADDRAVRSAWLDGFQAALRAADDRAVYVNFLGGDEPPERARDAFPGPTWDRLRQVKRRWDPQNLFRRNWNVPPATV
jgi:FAD/FMN-containing dehydrogenase